jgi:hypothetical protein
MIGKFCFAIPHHTSAVNTGDETKKAFHPSSLTPFHYSSILLNSRIVNERDVR